MQRKFCDPQPILFKDYLGSKFLSANQKIRQEDKKCLPPLEINKCTSIYYFASLPTKSMKIFKKKNSISEND